MLFCSWGIEENPVTYHQNLTLSLHCIYFAAKSKLWSIDLSSWRRSLLSASGPSLIQYYVVFLVVFDIEKYFDGMRCLRISPHNSGYGCDTSVCPSLLYHMIRDISPSIAIYHAISHRITQKAPGKNNFNENRPPCCGLRFALAPCLLSLLALSPAWLFLSSFCCPSDGHIVGLTVPLAIINLIPSWFGLLPECMIVFVPSFCFRSFPHSFPFLLYISHGIGIEISLTFSR